VEKKQSTYLLRKTEIAAGAERKKGRDSQRALPPLCKEGRGRSRGKRRNGCAQNRRSLFRKEEGLEGVLQKESAAYLGKKPGS